MQIKAKGMGVVSLVLCVGLFGEVLGRSQQVASSSDDGKAALLGAFEERKAGVYNSIGTKTASRLGDEAARILVGRYSLEELQTERFAKATAGILGDAFSTPILVTSVSDRKPKVSILLLTYLKLHQPDKETGLALASTLQRLEKLSQSNK